MDITSPQLVTTCIAIGGGTTDVPGVGEKHNVLFTGTMPDSGSTYALVLTDGSTSLQVQVGAGNITGIAPTFCFTYNNKAYLLAGSSGYFSALGLPTVFNDPLAVGNGFVSFSNQFKTSEDLVGMVSIQGRMAFLSRQTTQIWNINADPTQWSLAQLLHNIGSLAPLSIQPKGDLDAMFLSDSGVRSLRAREVTLNAFVDDTGSPIDALIQAELLNSKNVPGHPAGTPSASGGSISTGTYYYQVSAWVGGKEGPPSIQSAAVTVTGPNGSVALTWTAVAGATKYSVYRTTKSGIYDSPSFIDQPVGNTYTDIRTSLLLGCPITPAERACGIVEPTSGRYWLYIGGTIYVFSYFPSSKVQAWSTYSPTDNAGVPFAPTKFVVFKGQVFCRAGNHFYQYGGANGNTYDDDGITVATIDLPWLDLKTPGTIKTSQSINAAFSGTWTVSIGMDPVSALLEIGVWSSPNYTYDMGIVPVSGRGSHFKARFTSSTKGPSILSSLVFHYQEGEEV